VCLLEDRAADSMRIFLAAGRRSACLLVEWIGLFSPPSRTSQPPLRNVDRSLLARAGSVLLLLVRGSHGVLGLWAPLRVPLCPSFGYSTRRLKPEASQQTGSVRACANAGVRLRLEGVIRHLLLNPLRRGPGSCVPQRRLRARRKRAPGALVLLCGPSERSEGTAPAPARGVDVTGHVGAL
jgi:hypothetical protein